MYSLPSIVGVGSFQSTIMRSTGSTRRSLNGDRRQSSRIRSSPRASQACLSCAASKTRCDNDPTCGRCRRKNLQCTRVRLASDLLALNSLLAYDGYVYDTRGSGYHGHRSTSAQTNRGDAQTNTEGTASRPWVHQVISS
jgi:hypothetical protein